ncbi:MAG: hypothetical protein AAFO84_04055, partial [Cyanobacteria bacterium J06598_1]
MDLAFVMGRWQGSGFYTH